MSDIRKGSFNTERPEIAVRLFGAVELRRGAVRVGERRERESLPWTLLKYLLVNRGREVSMEELDAVLWAAPDGSATSSGNARVRLSRLRKLLEPVTDDKRGGGLVLCYGGRFALNSDYRLTFDCDEFAALCRAEQSVSPEDASALRDCERALELYGGEFLAFTAPRPVAGRLPPAVRGDVPHPCRTHTGAHKDNRGREHAGLALRPRRGACSRRQGAERRHSRVFDRLQAAN